MSKLVPACLAFRATVLVSHAAHAQTETVRAKLCKHLKLVSPASSDLERMIDAYRQGTSTQFSSPCWEGIGHGVSY